MYYNHHRLSRAIPFRFVLYHEVTMLQSFIYVIIPPEIWCREISQSFVL